MQVCDVGCGEGRFARQLAERGAVVTGIEPTVPLLAEARRRQPDGRFVEATAEAIPIASETFDLVVSYVMLIDVPDYRRAIHEMAQIPRRAAPLSWQT